MTIVWQYNDPRKPISHFEILHRTGNMESPRTIKTERIMPGERTFVLDISDEMASHYFTVAAVDQIWLSHCAHSREKGKCLTAPLPAAGHLAR